MVLVLVLVFERYRREVVSVMDKRPRRAQLKLDNERRDGAHVKGNSVVLFSTSGAPTGNPTGTPVLYSTVLQCTVMLRVVTVFFQLQNVTETQLVRDDPHDKTRL